MVEAQTTNSPAQTLRLAQSIYENGRLHELPTILGSVIANGNTTEKVSAYKLLTLAYIYLEEPEKADESMLKLLQTDPEFQKNDAIDPAEFVALYQTFMTDPVYRLGVKAGANTSQPNVKEYYPANDGPASYSAGYGFQVGVSGEIALAKKYHLNAELFYQAKGFKFANKYDSELKDTQGTQRQTWLSLPVSVQYNYLEHKLNPYVGLGVSTDFLIGSKQRIETLIAGESPVTEREDDDIDQYSKLNVSPMITAGIKRKVGRAMLIFELRYTYGVMNIVNKQAIFDNQLSVFGNKFVHGPFAINTLSLNTGYLINKYNPKKITRKR
jgi:hypothetical protein